MADFAGEKTEKATPKQLQKAFDRGQFARSPEIQTVFVLTGAMLALTFSGKEMWRLLAFSQVAVFSHLHDTPLTMDTMQKYTLNGVMLFGKCVWPILSATMMGGLLAGGLQTRFRTSPEVLGFNWERLNPVEGFKRTFSMRSAVPTGINVLKLSIISGLTWGVVKDIMSDPIFHSSVDMVRIAEFMADSSFRIIVRVMTALVILAAADYGYQYHRTNQDLMMTKEEVKEEVKSSESNPLVKTQQRRKHKAQSKRKMLAEVPKADVIIVNPVHIAIALRYDKKTMRAPKVVAKGSRLNALQIKEIAKANQVPIIENIPLARLMFKYCRVGGEVPAQLYAAVAEVLAWVYRVNAYRYYREQSL